MPELPEVETVRDGLDRWVTGRVVAAVEVRHPRSIRRHVAGADDLVARLVGRRVTAVSRRGKYLWLPLGSPGDDGPPDECLVGHLGMSGQLLVQPVGTPDEKHLHVRVRFADDGPELRFVDQRTFGGVLVDRLVPTPDRAAESVPAGIVHIARDPLDPAFDDDAFSARLRRRDSELKRALLDQSLISGIGNIYADESLWRARLHGRRRTATLTRAAVITVLASVREVLREAIRAGGTSFDALYVNVNGASGYFDRSLAVYGQEGRPCPRCGTPVRREQFMNRSSFSCPVCQPRPRATRTPAAQDTPRRSG
ncbi:bifunctional DNA-formamidopyrimidine glycosylase/DNA-(apurinic or apyrimidinic site) lyase [Jatrophihabitans endophyticus]|uniref:bifunctional DNA-formamidopyrimidine glycosylase/DNA-(apurinic or apyrimidinic site) lyase n=1 Tax=Jatrophihabitans endophyticus TaxID=1206085 RepID=UPI0019D9CB12|nr:bifunctional DNA-formamidopyrimidine glycosylase/DNA-(apurinic or apyrimidinic site) lyase [Jatrophihabitans endophyticus]MBE7188773.1 bifunctional DNA-formamidopyrimidine glycosylase/DNA-(apurinic or apyrimidinic site) lyase [Jatrophihabitans endophyticus]